MDYRKIVAFGKSSLVVTIPKKWIDKYKLSAGDYLSLKESGKGIVFFPREVSAERTPIENTISIADMSEEQLKRQIITQYINNTNVLSLTGQNVSSRIPDIRTILLDMIAFELVEQSTTKLTIRDFLDMDNLSIKNLLKRIDMIIRSMMIDAKQSTSAEETEIITNRDKDINKLSYLIFRKINYLNQNPSAKREISNTDLIKYWVLTSVLENIGDEIKRIVRMFVRLKTTKKNRVQLVRQFEIMSERYLRVLTAFYNRDVKEAYKLADEKEKEFDRLNEFFGSFGSAPLLISIHEKLKTILTYLNDVGKLIYN